MPDPDFSQALRSLAGMQPPLGRKYLRGFVEPRIPVRLRRGVSKVSTATLMRNLGEFKLSATGERCKILVGERNYIVKAYRRRLIKYNDSDRYDIRHIKIS